jgi:DNA-binding MarR family transcriptional regulator
LLYNSWGFTGSPFQTTSLPASELGERLLVGRAAELQSLERKICSAPKIATLEGLNGVGKTSIVNVAAHQLFQRHVDTGQGPLYIPARKIFQLNPGQDVQSFIDSVLMEVGQTLIEKSKQIQSAGAKIQTQSVDRWLNSPQLSSFQAGLWLVQGGSQRETNTSSGFERSGFRKWVFTWLEQIFPTPDSGGIICTIDNLELLQSSETARALLEQLRDELLNVPGIRWVLCGALGIVYGVVASPRLEGYLHKPIEVSGIADKYAPEILTSRIATYALDHNSYYLPLRSEDFARLYDLLQGNLRSVLSYADDYCQHIADGEAEPTSEESKSSAFATWLITQCRDAYEAVRQELRPKALEVFSNAVRLGGVFSPSDFATFGFNSIPAFRPHIRDLEAVGIVVSTQDDGDKRRKTIQVTPKGWLVHEHLTEAVGTASDPRSE